MSICICAITFNSLAFIDEFLDCIAAQGHPDWRLVIVDNASVDGTIERLAKIEDIRISVILNITNVGVAAATNQGIAFALEVGAENIVLMNNDTAFDSDLLSRLEESLEENNCDALSPLITFYDDHRKIWYAGGGFQYFHGFCSTHYNINKSTDLVPGDVQEVEYCPTTCMIIRKEVFEAVGPLDEQFFCYTEDSDYLWRMKLKGLKTVIDPSIHFRHRVSALTGGRRSDFSIRYNQRNQLYFTRKYHGWPLVLYTILAASFRTSVRVMAGRENLHQARVRFRAIREGLSVPVPATMASSTQFSSAAR